MADGTLQRRAVKTLKDLQRSAMTPADALTPSSPAHCCQGAAAHMGAAAGKLAILEPQTGDISAAAVLAAGGAFPEWKGSAAAAASLRGD